MVGFHLCYDLVYLRGAGLAWFAPPLQDIWRASISWTFLFIAGFMCSLSRSNLRRVGLYGAVALAVFVVTSFASVDAPISFGVIYCMSFSTLIAWLLDRAGMRPYGPVAALVLVGLFLVLYDVPRGFIGIGDIHVALPHQLYSHGMLSWLGLPGPGFVSSDYYPPIPFSLMFLSGAATGWWLKDRGYPAWMYAGCAPLEFVGRHALPIYVAHQPVLLLLTDCIA